MTPLKNQVLEPDVGINFSWIENHTVLKEWLDKGLDSLYADVFAEPPFSEKFEIPEVRDIFCHYMDNGADILVATPHDTDLPIALMVQFPLEKKAEVLEVLGNSFDPHKCIYFAEDAVSKDYRRRGISSHMKSLAKERAKDAGKDYMILRTNISNYAQINAVAKDGGFVIPGCIQETYSTKLSGVVEPDLRSIYGYNLKNDKDQPMHPFIEQARIFSTPAGDLLMTDQIVGDADWNHLKSGYPGLTIQSDRQQDAQGKLVFNAALYIPKIYGA